MPLNSSLLLAYHISCQGSPNSQITAKTPYPFYTSPSEQNALVLYAQNMYTNFSRSTSRPPTYRFHPYSNGQSSWQWISHPQHPRQLFWKFDEKDIPDIKFHWWYVTFITIQCLPNVTCYVPHPTHHKGDLISWTKKDYNDELKGYCPCRQQSPIGWCTVASSMLTR
jgi:hypothetical protein